MSENITFSDIGGGELVDLVNADIVDLIKDLRDPNKNSGGTRTLTVTLSFKTNEKRKAAEIEYKTSSKLGGRDGGKSHIYIDGDGENVKSANAPLNQPSFSFDQISG